MACRARRTAHPAAAEQGNADAQNNLGFMYEHAEGATRDLEQALRWYSAAAELGHPVAQANLADMYANGRGAPLDYVEAYKWFTLAEKQKLKVAVDPRKRLATVMTPRQFASADARVFSYQQSHFGTTVPQDSAVCLLIN